ncbi:hypothetical protein GCM10010277_75530 [Streptomyces longisporoflavus]|nr:hypothetical protein GCM10010277_75530 [Streptomyces longisporoflavus]
MTVISCCNHSRDGAPPGNGHPTVNASAAGTPTTSAANATKARNALTKSPAVRRRRGSGCGVRFRGADGPPVELEVVRAMAGVLLSSERERIGIKGSREIS